MPCRRRNWLRLTKQKARRGDLLARYLPKGVKVILLADRGFVHTDAMSVVRRLGWTIVFESRSTLGYGALPEDGYNPKHSIWLAARFAASKMSNSISSSGMARFMSSWDAKISMANAGSGSAMSRQRSKRFENTLYASILKNSSKTSSPGVGIYRNLSFALSVSSLVVCQLIIDGSIKVIRLLLLSIHDGQEIYR